MARGVNKAPRVRTLKEARVAFQRSGQSVRAWALANGFSVNLVYMVLAGQRPGLRGQSHKIAVRLGVKDGVVIEGEE